MITLCCTVQYAVYRVMCNNINIMGVFCILWKEEYDDFERIGALAFCCCIFLCWNGFCVCVVCGVFTDALRSVLWCRSFWYSTVWLSKNEGCKRETLHHKVNLTSFLLKKTKIKKSLTPVSYNFPRRFPFTKNIRKNTREEFPPPPPSPLFLFLCLSLLFF